jgi:hypothetical protein
VRGERAGISWAGIDEDDAGLENHDENVCRRPPGFQAAGFIQSISGFCGRIDPESMNSGIGVTSEASRTTTGSHQMKKLFTILACASLFAVTASAHDRCEIRSRVVGHTECGTPIIATLEITGHSRCGDPAFSWVRHYPRENHNAFRDHDEHCDRHEEIHRHHHDWH